MINQAGISIADFEAMKAEYPRTLLLFRVGNFYESLNEDAKIIAYILGTVLINGTDSIGEPCTFTGFPDHAVIYYQKRLVKAGYLVALCEQQEPPKNDPKAPTLF
jgi:DNA mismatch repair protein MutS